MGHSTAWTVMRSFVALSAIAACTVAAGQSTATDPSQDTEPVRVAAEHFLRVFDNLEWEQFRAVWAPEPTVFFPFDAVPERATGRAAVEATFQRFFDQTRATRPGPPYLHLNPRELLIERYGDTGIVTFMLGASGGRVGRRTLVFVRVKNEWKLVHLHASTAGQP
jgi:ketosteroid isomerase-like protein